MPKDGSERPLKRRVDFEKFAGPMGMDALPIEVSHMLERNQKIKICCRHMENIEATLYRTYTANEGAPDLIICECRICACKHYRVYLQGASFGT